MNTASMVIQAPASATSLVLLFHGVGAQPSDMAYVGERIAQQHRPILPILVVAGSGSR